MSDARASIPSYTARDGRLLVVRDGSLLPCRCPLCDKPAFGEVVTLRFSRRRRGRAGAGLFKFLIGLAIDRLSDYLNRDHYTGPVAVRMRLCRMHAARRRGMFVAGCVLLVGGSAGFLLTIYDRIGPWVGLPCLVGALIGFPVTVGLATGFLQVSLYSQRFDDRVVWLRGACPEFLAGFPELNPAGAPWAVAGRCGLDGGGAMPSRNRTCRS